MVYLLIKALHVTAVIVWVGSLLLQCMALEAVAQRAEADDSQPIPIVQWVLQWDRWVASPAMGLVWILGIAMAIQAHWFGTGWLSLKVVLVVVLSALHGIQVGTLRRTLTHPSVEAGRSATRTAAFILAAVLVIAVLVVTKPF